MRKTQRSLFITIVMGDSADWMVNKEKQAVRKLREAVHVKGWKRFVKTRRSRASFTRGPAGFEDG